MIMCQRPLPRRCIAVSLAFAAATFVFVRLDWLPMEQNSATIREYDDTMHKNASNGGGDAAAAVGSALGRIEEATRSAIHDIEGAAEKALKAIDSAAAGLVPTEGSNVSAAATTMTTNNKSRTTEPTHGATTYEPAYEGCCFMASHDLWPGPKQNVDCEGICFTERACNDTSYPFRSQEEFEWFKPWAGSAEQKRALKDRCDTLMETTPTARWCQDGNGIDLDRVPMGCSLFGFGGRSGPFDRMMLFPKGRLAFCGLPKAGVTQWSQFLRFVAGARDYQSLPHFKHDTQSFRFDTLDTARQSLILKDSNWTKAIIIRDPAERLLSAYLDKVYNQGSNIFPQFARDNITFAEFVDILEMNVTCAKGARGGRISLGISWCMDPHWRPQAWSCGLTELLPHFALVGSPSRTAEHTKQLLEKVGLWDQYGKRYRTSTREEAYARGGSICKSRPPPIKPRETPLGFQQAGQADVYGHSKGSKSKMGQYYDEKLLSKVRKLYAVDYALWDALQSFDGERAPSGGELSQRLNPSCSRQ